VRSIALIAAVALFACSRSDGAPAPLASDLSAPASAATGDPCVDACDAKFPGATSALEALDDCVVDSCQPIESSPSGGSCAAVGAGASRVSYGYARTDSCLAAVCCAQATACAKDPSCLQLSACLDTCNAR
jgi:hypothetical protein